MLEKAASIADHVTEFKFDRLEMRVDTLTAFRLKGAEQSVAPLAVINLRLEHCFMSRSSRFPAPKAGSGR